MYEYEKSDFKIELTYTQTVTLEIKDIKHNEVLETAHKFIQKHPELIYNDFDYRIADKNDYFVEGDQIINYDKVPVDAVIDSEGRRLDGKN